MGLRSVNVQCLADMTENCFKNKNALYSSSTLLEISKQVQVLPLAGVNRVSIIIPQTHKIHLYFSCTFRWCSRVGSWTTSNRG